MSSDPKQPVTSQLPSLTVVQRDLVKCLPIDETMKELQDYINSITYYRRLAALLAADVNKSETERAELYDKSRYLRYWDDSVRDNFTEFKQSTDKLKKCLDAMQQANITKIINELEGKHVYSHLCYSEKLGSAAKSD